MEETFEEAMARQMAEGELNWFPKWLDPFGRPSPYIRLGGLDMLDYVEDPSFCGNIRVDVVSGMPPTRLPAIVKAKWEGLSMADIEELVRSEEKERGNYIFQEWEVS